MTNAPPRLAIFTICSNNYLPMARALFASARRHHPEASLFLCLADRPCGPPDRYGHLAEIVPLETLDIPGLADFTFRYDIMELNTAAKPFMFLYLLEVLGFDRVLYFDPDIELYAPLASVQARLDAAASLVLTPHCCRPSRPHDATDDTIFMRAGIYNLGFLAAARVEEAIEILHWWARRLRYDCINDQGAGLFVDQKFFDLVPGFAPSAVVSHDPTLNVAYWNLEQRDLADDGRGGWTVDGAPLTFFHYSGFDPRTPTLLSRYAAGFPAPLDPPLQRLLDGYAARLRADPAFGAPVPAYAYGHFASGVPIPGCVRRMYRETHALWPDDPAVSYEEFLALPAPGTTAGAAPLFVTNLMKYLHGEAPWLRATYDIADPAHVHGFATRFAREAAAAFGLDPRLVAPVAAALAERPAAAVPPARDEGPDVSVVGYLRATSGVGEAGRMTLGTLSRAPGLRVEGLEVSLGVAGALGDAPSDAVLAERACGRFQILHINADQLPPVRAALGDRLRPDAYRIAVPFWELLRLPAAWEAAFDTIDEVWAPSRFVQMALAGRVAPPVIHMPLALPPLERLPGGRARFGLPARRFLFFFAFDFLSFPERKNPASLLAAFALAFPPGEGAPVGLVLKTLNGALRPAAFARLREAVAPDPRIVLIDRALDRADMTRLLGACDCVVSLHRSEGFGLLVAEAMQLEIPVIATDYGATVELVTPQTGWAVQCRTVPVADGAYPHAAMQVWADPDIEHAAWLMRLVRDDPAATAGRVAAARALVVSRHGPAAVAARQVARLAAIDRGAA